MFAYCGNNPSACSDPNGYAAEICFGDTFDVLSDPWRNAGGGGGRILGVRTSGKTSNALIEEVTLLNDGVKSGKFLSYEFSAFSLSKSEFTLLSFDASVVRLDITKGPLELSLFNLGNASASAKFEGWVPCIEAMVSLYSPSVSFDFGGTTVSFTLHLGACGVVFKPVPGDFKIGFAKNIGFSISFSS